MPSLPPCSCGIQHVKQSVFDNCQRTQQKTGKTGQAGGRYGKPTAPVPSAKNATRNHVGDGVFITGDANVGASALEGEVGISGGQHDNLLTLPSSHGTIQGNTYTSNVTITDGPFDIGDDDGGTVRIVSSGIRGKVLVSGDEIKLTRATVVSAETPVSVPGLSGIHIEGNRIDVRDTHIEGQVLVGSDTTISDSHIKHHIKPTDMPLWLEPGTHIQGGGIDRADQVVTHHYANLGGNYHRSVTTYPNRSGEMVAAFYTPKRFQVMTAANIEQLRARNREVIPDLQDRLFGGYTDDEMAQIMSELDRNNIT